MKLTYTFLFACSSLFALESNCLKLKKWNEVKCEYKVHRDYSKYHDIMTYNGAQDFKILENMESIQDSINNSDWLLDRKNDQASSLRDRLIDIPSEINEINLVIFSRNKEVKELEETRSIINDSSTSNLSLFKKAYLFLENKKKELQEKFDVNSESKELITKEGFSNHVKSFLSGEIKMILFPENSYLLDDELKLELIDKIENKIKSLINENSKDFEVISDLKKLKLEGPEMLKKLDIESYKLLVSRDSFKRLYSDDSVKHEEFFQSENLFFEEVKSLGESVNKYAKKNQLSECQKACVLKCISANHFKYEWGSSHVFQEVSSLASNIREKKGQCADFSYFYELLSEGAKLNSSVARIDDLLYINGKGEEEVGSHAVNLLSFKDGDYLIEPQANDCTFYQLSN